MTECERFIKEGLFTPDFFKPEVRCDFLVDEKRKKIWAVELDLLMQFDRVCKKHGLHYTLLVGSVLGAVRHCGIIPWDDDIDVGMLRSDYERFLQLKDEFPHPYFLQIPGEGEYFYAFAKLRNSNTTCLSENFRYRNFNHGIVLDVFPLDSWIPNDDGESVYRAINSLCIEQSTWMRMSNPELSENDKIRVANYSGRKPSETCKEIDLLAKRWSGQNTGFVAQATCGVYGFKRNLHPESWFENTVEMDFEGFKFPVLSRWEEYLKHVYGDYRKLPPVVDRGRWHDGSVLDPDVPYREFLKVNYNIVQP